MKQEDFLMHQIYTSFDKRNYKIDSMKINYGYSLVKDNQFEAGMNNIFDAIESIDLQNPEKIY